MAEFLFKLSLVPVEQETRNVGDAGAAALKELIFWSNRIPGDWDPEAADQLEEELEAGGEADESGQGLPPLPGTFRRHRVRTKDSLLAALWLSQVIFEWFRYFLVCLNVWMGKWVWKRVWINV